MKKKHGQFETTRMVEAEGFRDGAQGIDSTPALDEMKAQFVQRQEKEMHDSAERIKYLEGQINTMERRKTDADRHWSDLDFQTDGMPPPVILPFCAVILALLAVIGEAVFLAPIMDGFGIAEPSAQIILAAVIVIISSGLFEIAKRQFRQPTDTLRNVRSEDGQDETGPGRSRTGKIARAILFALLAGLTLMFVSVLGWWRAEEMIFAASTQEGAWRDFLRENPLLTRALVVLLTTGLPIFVALAFEWGVSELRLAWEWRKARHAYRKLSRDLDRTRKSLESDIEKRDSRIKALDEMRDEWANAYLQNYELGRAIGARQLPLWRVLLKIVAVALLLLALCLLVDPLFASYVPSTTARCLAYACVTLSLAGLYACYAVKSWDRPTARQLYNQRATIFRTDNDSSSLKRAPAMGDSTLSSNGKKKGVSEPEVHALLLK